LLSLAASVAVAPASAAPSATDSADATDVLDFGADPSGSADSTGAFLRAEDAALASPVRFADGPAGRPQARVYVPPGTYRLLRLPFRSDVRMEVSSGAVLEQAGGRNIALGGGPPALIVWDGQGTTPLRNVTLIGVADGTASLKSFAAPVFPGWSVDEDFTFDLDPARTDASVLVTGLLMYNVQDFLVQNVFSVENDWQPAVAPTTDDGWWPQSRKAALSLNERSDTPSDGSVFYDAHGGTIDNWYNVGAPKGFGANQINAGHDLTLRHIYSRGGTPLRLETDASQKKYFASEVRGLDATDIVGENCNRTVIFAPHAQFNYDVHVSGVRSVGCGEGVLETVDESNKRAPGAFIGSTISDVVVTAGLHAQLGLPGANGLWTVGRSSRAFAKDTPARAQWSVVYQAGTYSCSGAFAAKPTAVLTTVGLVRPVCT
jgi:hypothetical protein